MKREFSIGLFLISIGVILLLLIFNLLKLNWLFLTLSLGLILLYYYKENMVYLIVGLVLLAMSSVSLIDQYLFINIRITSFIYFFAAGIFGIVSYIRKPNNVFLILGTLLLALGSHNLIQQLVIPNIGWLRIMLISLAFYISYHIGYKDNGIIWPKYISIIFLFIGALSLLYYKGLFDLTLGNLFTYLISITIILLGIRIFYTTLKHRR